MNILYIEAVSMLNKLPNRKMFNKNLPMNLTSLLLLASLSQVSFAQTELNKESHSISGLKNKETFIEKAKNSERTLAFKGMDRANVKEARQRKTKKLSTTSSLTQAAEQRTSFYHSFSIYNGYSQLINDIDGDGYYQSFSVTFDADILSPEANEQALVFADLYLSQNGGPWVLFFSTDDFIITGEDSEDAFEVVTVLDSGYEPDQYDVLIDLFEVGYSDVVSTYSSNDSNDLYALPLESRDYDPEYIDVEYHEEHGGGSSWLLLGALFAFVFRRR